MPYEIDETHDPSLESWVESANDPGTDFPIQNLPLCSFLPKGEDADAAAFLGVRIGDSVLDLHVMTEEAAELLSLPDHLEFTTTHESWNNFARHATEADRSALRRRLSHLLRSETGDLRDHRLKSAFVKSANEVTFCPPTTSADYTDFYASAFHATNVGSMFRPDNPLLPNYKWIPIGYHGRASSIVPSGTPITRPVSQQAPAEDGGSPAFGPCKMLDYELEVGFVVGRGNELGERISIEEAEDHIFGMCLVNDWSARDIQKWEYQPLGPFLSKSFATTVSPYIVTMEALAPFRTPAYERPAGDPRPLPYLDSERNRAAGGVDITLEVYLSSKQMRDKGIAPVRLSKGTFRDMYWTIGQMLTHHTVNGCNMRPGDLLASGTVSGRMRDSRGCMLELTWDGDPFANPPKIVPGTQRTPISLPTGEERRFLADGDEVIIKGYCERDGYRRIGFGECRGVIEPARS